MPVDIQRPDLPSQLRTGKRLYKLDERTLAIGPYMALPPGVTLKVTYDFDKKRSPFPRNSWGNDEYGDCVLAGRANQHIRNERVQTRRTMPITDEMVITKYKQLTGCVSAGDANDTGLVVLNALVDWRHGWQIPIWKQPRDNSIDAFGQLNYSDREELRAAIFLLRGVQFGIGLPLTALDQLRRGLMWDVVPDANTNPRAEPWSWGGHLVYSCHYDSTGYYVWTWGVKQYMTNDFVERYADEAYAVVDHMDDASRWLDVPKLLQYLKDIGASGIQ